MVNIFIEPSTLPETFDGLLQVIFLGCVYGYVLFQASNLISDGSELLLLIPSMAGIVGSVILPILGAVPDGAIILFSGLGPNAQEEVAVGVGALAGSTIMLLTIPWFMSIFGGRVDIQDGTPKYSGHPRLTPGSFGLRSSGVSGSSYVAMGGRMMILTATSYLIIQIPAFYSMVARFTSHEAISFESSFALVGAIMCLALFGYYLWHCMKEKNSGEAKVLEAKAWEARKRLLHERALSLTTALQDLMQSQEVPQEQGDRAEPFVQLTESPRFLRIVRDLLYPFFQEIDMNNDGKLSLPEVRTLLTMLNETPTEETLESAFSAADKDKNEAIDLNEFVEMMLKYAQDVNTLRHIETNGRKVIETKEDEEEEEEAEIPEDIQHLSAAQQRRIIKIRSFTMLLIGTVLVLTFSDPMCGVLSDAGRRTGIPAFYISFVLAPLASNASEVIASFNYSRKKTRKATEIAFSALIGAANMNNTFCLAIFLFLVYFKSLEWTFAAETLSILIVQVAMFAYSQKKTMTMYDGLAVLSLYPLSLLAVNVMETLGLS